MTRAIATAAEVFRDWKSAEAEKVRPAIVWYLDELKSYGQGS